MWRAALCSVVGQAKAAGMTDEQTLGTVLITLAGSTLLVGLLIVLVGESSSASACMMSGGARSFALAENCACQVDGLTQIFRAVACCRAAETGQHSAIHPSLSHWWM